MSPGNDRMRTCPLLVHTTTHGKLSQVIKSPPTATPTDSLCSAILWLEGNPIHYIMDTPTSCHTHLAINEHEYYFSRQLNMLWHSFLVHSHVSYRRTFWQKMVCFWEMPKIDQTVNYSLGGFSKNGVQNSNCSNFAYTYVYMICDYTVKMSCIACLVLEIITVKVHVHTVYWVLSNSNPLLTLYVLCTFVL